MSQDVDKRYNYSKFGRFYRKLIEHEFSHKITACMSEMALNLNII